MPDDLEGEDDGGLTERLMARSGPGLYRRRMPDGGEVVTGPTAQRALGALGARAFTMDKTIFVDERFDISSPEDAALYAHERHHQMESGGDDDGHSGHDAEEVAARAIESMVLHRSRTGDDLQSILRDVDAGNLEVTPAASGEEKKEKSEDQGAEGALRKLLMSGKSLEEISQMLTRHILDAVNGRTEDTLFRGPGGQY
jgi:hypothetical protein